MKTNLVKAMLMLVINKGIDSHESRVVHQDILINSLHSSQIKQQNNSSKLLSLMPPEI